MTPLALPAEAHSSMESERVGPLRAKLSAARDSSVPPAISSIRHEHHHRLCSTDPLLKHIVVDGNETFDLVSWHALPVFSLFTLHSSPRGSDFVFEKTSHIKCRQLCVYDQFDLYQLGQLPVVSDDSFLFSNLRSSEDMVAALPEVNMKYASRSREKIPEHVTFQLMRFCDIAPEQQMFFVDGNQQPPLPHSALYLRDAQGVLRVGTYADYMGKFSTVRIAPSKTGAYDSIPNAIVTVLIDRDPS